MQHAKLEFRTFMNFVIILQKKNLMKLPYSVSLKQENCRRLWCKLIDTTWKISKVMITYLTTYIHSVLHISNGPTTSLFKRSHSVSERFYISIFPCLLPTPNLNFSTYIINNCVNSYRTCYQGWTPEF